VLLHLAGLLFADFAGRLRGGSVVLIWILYLKAHLRLAGRFSGQSIFGRRGGRRGIACRP